MKTLKTLENLFKLSSNVKIYVPSTMDVNVSIDASKYVDQTLSFLAELFGGSTDYKALGCWKSVESGLVKEHVEICESYCDQVDLEKHIEKIVEHCEYLKKEMKQEAIALEINNELYFI